MDKDETQQMLLSVIEYAQTAKPVEFRSIQNWSEYKFYRSRYKLYSLLIKALQNSLNRLMKSYCKEVQLGISDFNKLLAYRQIALAKMFYSQETSIISDMLCDYEVYLSNGNFLWSFLGAPRVEENINDFGRN